MRDSLGRRSAGTPQRFDFTREHILESVEGILKRLGTDRLDILLLHRPDPLWEGEEIAQAFRKLHLSGKVRYFGVSNQNRFQMEYLQSFLSEALVANQMEMNLLHHGFVEVGISFNQSSPRYPDGWEGTMEYCRLKGVLLQAWSPLAQGILTGNLDHQPGNVKETALWCRSTPSATKPLQRPYCWHGFSNTQRRSSPC